MNDNATLNRVLGAAGEQALQDDDAAVDALFALHDAKIARAREVFIALDQMHYLTNFRNCLVLQFTSCIIHFAYKM